MGKMILGFLVLFGLVFLSIQGFAAASGRERMQLTKAVTYSMVCATIAVGLAAAIVILF